MLVYRRVSIKLWNLQGFLGRYFSWSCKFQWFTRNIEQQHGIYPTRLRCLWFMQPKSDIWRFKHPKYMIWTGNTPNMKASQNILSSSHLIQSRLNFILRSFSARLILSLFSPSQLFSALLSTSQLSLASNHLTSAPFWSKTCFKTLDRIFYLLTKAKQSTILKLLKGDLNGKWTVSLLCSGCSLQWLFLAVPPLCTDCSLHQVFSGCSLQWLLLAVTVLCSGCWYQCCQNSVTRKYRFLNFL